MTIPHSHTFPRTLDHLSNLRSAAKVLGFSRQRIETQRRTALRSHHGLDVFYCQPGIEGAREKGGIEGPIG